MDQAALIERLKAKLLASFDAEKMLLEQLAEVPGALTVADDGRDLIERYKAQKAATIALENMILDVAYPRTPTSINWRGETIDSVTPVD